ncbi:hypothetical protein [Streptomyces sp. SBT349]|uniref:hypothetical protein n=1 Tax=Streptomyces sp. SBT349 TaxID=1580539 RepID=UPI00066E98A9|nr:hypothetical protein [Streptomyces sp. SBT349]
MRRRLTLISAALLLATACGGSGGDGDGDVPSASDGGGDDGGAATEQAADPVEQSRLFAECLRENGIDIPDPDPETGELDFQAAIGEDGSRDALMEAFEACRELAPEGVNERPEPTEDQQEAMRDLAACLRENGLEVPDPDPVEGFEPGAIDPSAPGFDAAMEACEEHLTGLGRG